jgi:hypothetical protein
MKESLWTAFANCFGTREFQNLEQLIEYEQEVIQNRHEWEYKLDEIVKQLYHLKRNTLCD